MARLNLIWHSPDAEQEQIKAYSLAAPKFDKVLFTTALKL
jgi:hypothetical protein